MHITSELVISTTSIFEALKEVPSNEMTGHTQAIFAGLLAQAAIYENANAKIKEKAGYLASAALELQEKGYTTWAIVALSIEIDKLTESKAAAVAAFKAIGLIAGLDVS